MHGTRVTSYIRNTVALTAISIALSGCLMGNEKSKSNEEVAADNRLTGSVGDGPIVGATIKVRKNDGELLAEFLSGSNASYDATIRTKNGSYPLTIEAIGGTDLVTNDVPDFDLVGAVFEPDNSSVANINPFSTITIEIARELPGGISMENLEMAESYATSAMSSGLSSLLNTGPMRSVINSTNIAEIVKSSESLAEIIRRTRDLHLMFNRPTSGNQVLRAMASDLSDATLDGVGLSRTEPRTSAIATLVAVQVYLESMQNELHVNDVNAMAAMDAAIMQTTNSSATTMVGDVHVTDAMILSVRVGLNALIAVDSDPKIVELNSAFDSIQPGMDSVLIRTLMPADYRQTLQASIQNIAGADDSVIDTINSVVRAGIDDPDVNQAPSISGTPATTVLVGSGYLFTPSAADPEGDALIFSISNRPPWASFDTATGRLIGTPTSANAGSFNNIDIRVTDGEFTVGIPTFSILVTEDNTAPMISGTPPSQLSVGAQYDFTPSASDPDGSTMTFSINNRPSWASFNTSTGRLSGSPGPNDAGAHNNILISVSDGAASASLPAFSIIVNAVNSVPTISGAPSNQVTVGGQYDFSPTANDADGDTLTFNITNQPAWATFDSATGQLSGTPAAGDVGPHNNIGINVTDGGASAVLPAFSIIVNLNNSTPSISGTPNTQVSVGGSYDFTPTANDPDGNALTFSITNQPAWASFDSTTGRVSGSPASTDVGPHNNIVISVTDGAASSSLAAFSINVTTTNAAPIIAGSPQAQVVVGSVYDFVPTASDSDGDALTFSIGNQPSWTSFDTATGRLSGTPGAGNTGAHNNIVISVSDGAASANLAAFSIIVNTANSAPTISGNPPNQVTVGNQYNFTPLANDADGDSLTFSVTNRPAWLSFDPATGNLSGAPGAADVGSHNNIVINVSDGQASASLAAFTLTVDPVPNSAPTIGGTPANQVIANSPYSFTPTASDPDGDNLTFSVTGLPVWATFSNSNGRISGTPDAANVGVYSNIQISVSDGTESASLASFSITVNAISLGSVTLNWTPPTENEDGTALTDLAGYRFYWGTTPGIYTDSVTVNNPGLATYVVGNLVPGTYEFVATSINDAGVESVYSNPATKVVP